MATKNQEQILLLKSPSQCFATKKSAARICTGEDLRAAIVGLYELLAYHYSLKQLVLCDCLDSIGQPGHFLSH